MQTLEEPVAIRPEVQSDVGRRAKRSYAEAAVVLIAATIFFGCLLAPPALMDDVDAVHAQISRNMLDSHDWTIAHLDGVPYMEKAPLLYWMMALSYRVFGVHDWAARIPIALAAVLLCWIVARYAGWAFGRQTGAGFYAGVALATCCGLFLFTRILIPDVMLSLCICLSFWSFQRALEREPEEPGDHGSHHPSHHRSHPRRWAALLAVSLAVGVLLKGLIALVVPVGGALVYLAITRQLFSLRTWRRLHVFSGALIFLIIAAPWHIIAARAMPPIFDFTMHSGPGEYHGFFWFYFMNEHVLRFLGLRYPHDYNTVPRLLFWLMNLLWLFPWSFYFPAAAKLSYKPVDRAGRTRLLALCWAGFLLLFFTFSTTQEYYSMPIYPALALLVGSALATAKLSSETRWLRIGSRTIASLSAAAAAVIGVILFRVRSLPTPGDISKALQQHPEAYTLSLGHMGDLTLQSFAYLRTPLMIAGVAFVIGAVGGWSIVQHRAVLAFAVMMVLFCHASRSALAVFDPYLSSRPLATALQHAPEGRLIIDGEYYSFSSVFFYANRTALLLNGRRDNLEYGSYAPQSPGAPRVFIDDADFARLWGSAAPYYVLTDETRLAQLGALVGPQRLHQVAASGGKFLFTNGMVTAATLHTDAKDNGALW